MPTFLIVSNRPCSWADDGGVHADFLERAVHKKLSTLKHPGGIDVQLIDRAELGNTKRRRELASQLAQQPTAIWLDGCIATVDNWELREAEILARKDLIRLAKEIFLSSRFAQIFLGTNSKTKLDDKNQDYVFRATPALIHGINTDKVAPQTSRRFIDSSRHREYLAGEQNLVTMQELYRPSCIQVQEQIGNFVENFIRFVERKGTLESISA
jgi:hypothetical protein